MPTRFRGELFNHRELRRLPVAMSETIYNQVPRREALAASGDRSAAERSAEPLTRSTPEDLMPKRFRKDAVAAVMAAATVVGTAPGQAPKATADRASRHVINAVAAPRRGRPRKFSRPSRAVTLTLPDDVIAALRTVDSDLGRAIVRAIQPLEGKAPRPPAELTMYGGRAVIIVPRSRALIDRTGVELVPLTDGRALISFDQRMSVSQLELRIMDALADPSFEGADRSLFEALSEILRGARQNSHVSLRQRSIIVLHWTKPGAGDADEGADSDAEFV